MQLLGALVFYALALGPVRSLKAMPFKVADIPIQKPRRVIQFVMIKSEYEFSGKLARGIDFIKC